MTLPIELDAAVVRLPGARCFGPFTLCVAAGERVAILGPSGAGKSTLLKLIAGDWPAREGQVRLAGQDLSALRVPERARLRAVLPQNHGAAFGMPVELVVGLGRIAREPDPALPQIVAAALAAACATHLLGRRIDTLSGGEQARVMLARVFAQAWDLQGGCLLVDEPLAALDPGLQIELGDALLGFCAMRGHALVAVLHDLNLALAHFHRLWLLRDGQVVSDLPASRAAVPALEDLFGITLHCVDVQGDGAQDRIAVLPRRAAVARAASAFAVAEAA